MVNNTAQQISVIVSIKSGVVNCYPSIEFVENNFLVIFSYNLEMLAQCNDSIHEHNTRGCHELRVLPGAKTFSNISARIWNVLSNKINCDVSMSIFKCNLKLFLLNNELVLNYPK